jgi:cytochrome P450
MPMSANPYRIPDEIARSLVDPAAYTDQRIYDAYRWLRLNQPVGLAAPEGYDPFWVASKYADVQQVSRSNSLFLNSPRSPTLIDRASDQLIREANGGSPHLLRSLVQLDAPEHPKVRLLTQLWFAPGNLQKIESRIRSIAKATADKMLALGGRCDFVNDIALHYPLHVVMNILGVPEADEPLMLKLTQEIFAPLDPDLGPNIDRGAAVAALGRAVQTTVKVFGEYFGRISAERRASPREDIISVIANARIDGQPLAPEVELGYYVIVAAAGHDTTSSSTAGAVWGLCENPEQWARLKADPKLIPAMVDEAIRWTTPVKTFMRTAAADTELRGRPIAAGDWLMLCYASANRDEEVFADGDRFRIDRTGTKHISFGGGAHVCLGQHLARMEMRMLFEELLPRLKTVAFDGQPTMSAATFVNGPKTLPIRFEVE